VEGICDQCGGRLVQRDDDRPESIRVRMQAFEECTRPLSEYYRLKGKLMSVRASGSPEEILERTCRVLIGRRETLPGPSSGAHGLREAERAYGLAVRLWEVRSAESPVEPNCKNGISAGYLNVGNALFLVGRVPEAERANREAIRISKELVETYPDGQIYWIRLSTVLSNQRELLLDSYRLDESRAVYEEMHQALEGEARTFADAE
jgi:hypothetical protein